jgi:hypothetical protein
MLIKYGHVKVMKNIAAIKARQVGLQGIPAPRPSLGLVHILVTRRMTGEDQRKSAENH